MLETQVTVVSLDGSEAIVEAGQTGGCGYCNSINGCGASKLSKLLCTRPRQFRVHNGIGAKVGDEVRVSVADGELLRSALIAYIIPLLMLFAGGVLGTVAAGAHDRDLCAAVGALAGLAAGFIIVRLFTPRQQILISALSAVIAPCDNKPGIPSPGYLPAQERQD